MALTQVSRGLLSTSIVDNGNATAITIDSSENVGINTTSPAYKLDVAGSVRLKTGATGTPVIVSTGSDSQGTLRFGSASTEYSINGGADYLAMIFNTNGSERMRIDSSGNLLVGTTDAAVGVGNTNTGNSIGAAGYAAHSRPSAASLFLNRNTSNGAIAEFNKNGSLVGSIGVAATSDYFAVGNNNTSIQFYAGGIVPATGSVSTFSDNAKDLGSLQVRWDDVYATNGTIQTSDRNEKQDIAELSDAEQRVAVAAKGLLRKFRWISSVEENGDDARIHFGIIAQDLQDAFTAEGLDAGRYAMFISSTWTDEDTGEERTRLGVRYSELLAFIISAI